MVFGRVIKVRFIRESQNILLDFLAFHFEIKEVINQPAEGYLDIFNPSKKIAKDFFRENVRVQIIAGYRKQGEGIIFDGSILSIESSRQGADNKYTLYLQSHANFSSSPINISLQGSTNKNILTILNRNIDYTLDIEKLPLKTYESFNMFATPLVILKRIVSDARYIIYYQTQGRITFRHIEHSDYISSFTIPSLSLSSPLTKTIQNQEETLSFSTIFNPSYSLLSTYILKTQDFQGEIYPISLTWQGNNFTGSFFNCTIEGKMKGIKRQGIATGFLGKMAGDF